MERSLLTGLAALRWAGWVWMATVLLLLTERLTRPYVAWALALGALAFTAWATVMLRRSFDTLTRPATVWAEATLAGALVLADGFVYPPDHLFSAEASLGIAWPLAGVIGAGVVLGPLPGLLAGVAMGVARAVSTVANLPGGAPALTGQEVLSLLSTTFNYGLAGGVGGFAARQVVQADRAIAAARAREEVARTLHDGVLQTLAVVERRADDPALARLARDQERELRDFLFGTGGPGLVGRGALGDALRAVAGRAEARYGGRVDVLVPDDLPDVDDDVCQALAGAVGEALTNAGKHGDARRTVVYVEPQEGAIFCSVKDDGAGFDPDGTREGEGLRSSIRGRIAEVGGRVEIVSAPGRGAEIRLTVPAA